MFQPAGTLAMAQNAVSEAAGVRQEDPCSNVPNVPENGGKVAQYWAFRFTASKCSSEKVLESLTTPWVEEYGFQKERGTKRGTEHFQGSFSVNPKKRFKQLESHFKEVVSDELIFDGRDYLQPSKSCAANGYGIKEATRIEGPWWKGERFDTLAKELVYTIDIELRPWQHRIVKILDNGQDDRTIWWFWEPEGGAGKTTFQKWIYMNYEKVMISGGKAHDMKNGVVRYKERRGVYPKIVIINLPKTFDLNYFSAAGAEEVKDMFFFSGKYGGKDEDGEVCGKPPIMLIFANRKPPMYEMALDRWKIRELPHGTGKVVVVDEETWDD